MKYLSIILAAACIGLGIALFVIKQNGDKQHQDDTDAIGDFSNRLVSAETHIADFYQTILVLSNRLDQSQSTSLDLSNHLADAQSELAADAEQITNLNQKVAAAESDNQSLNQHFTDLTNRMTGQITNLTGQLTLTQSNLDQSKKDYVLLENRLRRDVAERVVVERKFNNLSEVQAQVQKLKKNPAAAISAQQIYEGLDVEVKSNAVHVISPN